MRLTWNVNGKRTHQYIFARAALDTIRSNNQVCLYCFAQTKDDAGHLVLVFPVIHDFLPHADVYSQRHRVAKDNIVNQRSVTYVTMTAECGWGWGLLSDEVTQVIV